MVPIIIATILSILAPGFTFAVVAGDQGPSQEEISQFEQQFGGPPEAFETSEVEKPKFEQPGKVPEEVKQYIGDAESVPVYCAILRWKSGGFFSALEAVKKHVVPAIEKVKELGIEVSLPNLESLKAEGLKRINDTCNAPTLAEAEKSVQEFSDWGQNEAAAKFTVLKSDLEGKIKTKGDELREKIKSQIDSFVAEKRSKIEIELRQEAEQLAVQKQAELAASQTPPDVAAIQNEIRDQIMARVETRKAEIKAAVEAKIDEITGGQKEKFEEIGKLFQGIGAKISGEIQARQGDYDQYKREAFQLRKDLVFKILDKNIEDGLGQLDAAQADIEQARKEDSSIKSVGEIKSEINQDRNLLSLKLDAALEAGDEAAFQAALSDFRLKWQGFRTDMEKAASQSVAKACTVALAQFDQAKTKINPGLEKIKNLQSKCADSTAQECLKVNELSPRFGTLTAKLTDIQSEMAMVESMCRTPETADRKNLIALMKKIQNDADDVRVYGEALEAEKSKAIADSAQQICSNILPQLAAAENEIKNNGLTVLENNASKCKGKKSEECGAVNNLAGDVNKLKERISGFSVSVQKAEDLCSNDASEENFKTLGDTLNILKSDGDVLRDAAQDLKAKQSERMNEKALCRAVAPQLESAKRQIAGGLSYANSIDKTVVSANSSKFNDLKRQAQTTLGNISDINSMCVNASADKLDQSLIDAMDGVKKDQAVIDEMVADLKAIEAGAGKANGIAIEAENESSSFIYPISQRPAPNAKEINISWRPAYFGSGDWYLAVGGEYLIYNFTAPKDGTYNIWVRDYVDNFQARGIRKIVVSFDGKKYGVFSENNSFVPSDNKKGILAWHKIGNGLALKAGQHMMKIMKEATTRGAAILDSFYLTTGAETPPEK